MCRERAQTYDWKVGSEKVAGLAFSLRKTTFLSVRTFVSALLTNLS